MKRVLLLMLLAWAVTTRAPVLRAQNTPFQNPSLDSNCYFPQIGDPSEMDTIVGAPGQDLGGSVLKNLGPKPDGNFGNMLIGNISPSVALAQVATGPSFDLHRMREYIQKIAPNTDQNGIADGFKLGHFRDRSHLDIFVDETWRIYWADDNGNYDSTRYSQLVSNVRGDRFWYDKIIPSYCTYLTSDSVEDIVLGIYSDWKNSTKDSSYLVLFRGGPSLFQKDTAYEDTSCRLFPSLINYPYRTVLQGDFRGTGRDDLILEGGFDFGWPGSSPGDFFFYANNPPFSLEKLAQAINNDTLMAGWQVDIRSSGSIPLYAMSVLPKNAGNHSIDFLFVASADTFPIGIFMFRGGSEFGSRRLRPDSAAFVITHPQYGFGTTSENWPQSIADAGDMTGTGNHVLFTTARNDVGDYWWNLSYVTGKALDNKVDIWNSAPYSEWPGDTLTSNADSLEDYLFGAAWPTAPAGDPNANSLWLYYGTKEIPVHLNPEWASVKTEIEKIPKRDGSGISFAPNPIANAWSVATIVWPDAENADYGVYDMLGRQCQHGTIRLLGGAEEQRIYFSGLPAGVYIFTITGKQNIASTRIVKLGEDSGGGTPEPSFIQQVKDARDEPGVTHGSHLSVY